MDNDRKQKKRYIWLIRGIVVLLLFAVGTKVWQLATVPELGDGLLHARWFNIFVVEFELAFVIWLIFGMFPELTRLATIGLFTVFAGTSLYKALSGESSCGCFGAVQVNPWWTFALDVILIGLLLSIRVAPDKTPNISLGNIYRNLVTMFFLWLVIAVPMTYTITGIRSGDFENLGSVFVGTDGKRTILIEPEKWPKGRFPLLPYIEPPEVRETLKSGNWIAVLYHHDCRKCQATINDFAAKKTPQVVCIEIPPYGTTNNIPEQFIHAKLTDRLSWFLETPNVVQIIQHDVSPITADDDIIR